MPRLPRLPTPRFSLRALLLALFVLSLFGSNLYVSWKWHEARQEIDRLRDDLGYLTIDDPSRFYVRGTPMHLAWEWRWRVYVPADAVCCIADHEIPETGVTKAEHVYRDPFPRGEHLVDLRLERLESGEGALSFARHGVDDFNSYWTAPVSREHAPWLCGPDETDPPEDGWVQPETEESSSLVAESFSFDEPVVLLRFRKPRRGQCLHEPCDGLIVWVERGVTEARQKVSNAGNERSRPMR